VIICFAKLGNVFLLLHLLFLFFLFYRHRPISLRSCKRHFFGRTKTGQKLLLTICCRSLLICFACWISVLFWACFIGCSEFLGIAKRWMSFDERKPEFQSRSTLPSFLASLSTLPWFSFASLFSARYIDFSQQIYAGYRPGKEAIVAVSHSILDLLSHFVVVVKYFTAMLLDIALRQVSTQNSMF
jgi:hypothetical protein